MRSLVSCELYRQGLWRGVSGQRGDADIAAVRALCICAGTAADGAQQSTWPRQPPRVARCREVTARISTFQTRNTRARQIQVIEPVCDLIEAGACNACAPHHDGCAQVCHLAASRDARVAAQQAGRQAGAGGSIRVELRLFVCAPASGIVQVIRQMLAHR